MNRIVAAVIAEAGGVTIDGLKAYNRRREYSIPRQLIMYLGIEQGYSSKTIGAILHRTHVTVLYGHRAVASWIEYPLSYKTEMDFLNRVLTKLNQRQ